MSMLIKYLEEIEKKAIEMAEQMKDMPTKAVSLQMKAQSDNLAEDPQDTAALVIFKACAKILKKRR